MKVYSSEHEQIEALRRWWEKNGRSILVAVVLVLAIVFGWQTWQNRQETQAAAASAAYEQLLTLVERDPKAALQEGRKIVSDHPGSNYAALASLAMAKLAVEEGQLDQAAVHLRWAADNASQPEVAKLARLRLARVTFAQEKLEEALALLEEEAGPFDAAYEELKGDIYLAKGEEAKARAAYQAALDGLSDVPAKQAILRLKVDNLAAGEDQQ